MTNRPFRPSANGLCERFERFEFLLYSSKGPDIQLELSIFSLFYPNRRKRPEFSFEKNLNVLHVLIVDSGGCPRYKWKNEMNVLSRCTMQPTRLVDLTHAGTPDDREGSFPVSQEI